MNFQFGRWTNTKPEKYCARALVAGARCLLGCWLGEGWELTGAAKTATARTTTALAGRCARGGSRRSCVGTCSGAPVVTHRGGCRGGARMTRLEVAGGSSTATKLGDGIDPEQRGRQLRPRVRQSRRTGQHA
jgi:hypothetical protein